MIKTRTILVPISRCNDLLTKKSVKVIKSEDLDWILGGYFDTIEITDEFLKAKKIRFNQFYTSSMYKFKRVKVCKISYDDTKIDDKPNNVMKVFVNDATIIDSRDFTENDVSKLKKAKYFDDSGYVPNCYKNEIIE